MARSKEWTKLSQGITNDFWNIIVIGESKTVPGTCDGTLVKNTGRDWSWHFYPSKNVLKMQVGGTWIMRKPKHIPQYVWEKIKELAEEKLGKPKSSMERKSTKDPLVSFLYELMRDHVTPGVVEKVMSQTVPFTEHRLCNGYLASYAEDIAKRLRKGK